MSTRHDTSSSIMLSATPFVRLCAERGRVLSNQFLRTEAKLSLTAQPRSRLVLSKNTPSLARPSLSFTAVNSNPGD